MNRKKVFLVLLLFFIVYFPKAGIKVSEIPVTFGYLLVAICGLFATASLFYTGQFRLIDRSRLTLLLSLLPLQLYSIICIALLGSESLGATIAYVVSFILLPVVFIFILRRSIDRVNIDLLLRLVRWGVGFVCIYGIFLFFWRLKFGYFIEVPYLTVNADDVGTLDGKHNARADGILKLISTYNNGNIFGVCLLMLLPLYDSIQKSFLMKIVVRVALVLTLSRTVWLGLFAYELISALYIRRATSRSVIALTISLLASAILVALSLDVMGVDADFVFDAGLGGRSEIVQKTSFSLLPNQAIVFPSEIIYVSIINAFGVVGLFLFLPAIVMPLIISWMQSRKSRINRSITAGMLMFLLCGMSDGAMLLIPTMALFWGLATFGSSQLLWRAYRESN